MGVGDHLGGDAPSGFLYEAGKGLDVALGRSGPQCCGSDRGELLLITQSHRPWV